MRYAWQCDPRRLGNCKVLRMSKPRFKNAMERWRYQRETINQLHFVYQRLQRMLPRMARRVSEQPLVQVLVDQQQRDGTIAERLAHVASVHGLPPQPSFSETANAIVSEFYVSERRASRTERDGVVLTSLRSVREYLLETWSRLVETLATEEEIGFRNEVTALMQQEEERYKELVELRLRVKRER